MIAGVRSALLLLAAACHHGASGPPPPSCTGVAEHVYGMLPQDDHGKSLRDVLAARCTKDAWDVGPRNCIMDTKTLHDGHHCKDRLTPDQRVAFESDLEAIEKKRAAELPAECERYRLAMAKIATCDKLPQAARDALKQAFDAMARGWLRYGDQPPEGKRATIAGCKQAFENLEQYGKSICGW